jgi:hypothetical protein
LGAGKDRVVNFLNLGVGRNPTTKGGGREKI